MVAYNTFGETFSNVTSLIFGFSKAGLCLNNNGNNWTIFLFIISLNKRFAEAQSFP